MPTSGPGSRPGRLRRPAPGARGFTLIEVLVALTIVAVTLGAGIKAAGALTGTATAATVANTTATAANTAAQVANNAARVGGTAAATARLVTKLGGRIELQSRAGKGTTGVFVAHLGTPLHTRCIASATSSATCAAALRIALSGGPMCRTTMSAEPVSTAADWLHTACITASITP